MSDTTVYTYDAGANPDISYIPGVPLRDLTASDLESFPPWLRASVAACPFYRKAERAKVAPSKSDKEA